MILRAAFRANRKPARFWFAWRPVRTQCGALVWLEVVECVRGYQVGDTPKRRGGAWTEYRLANE